MFQSGYLLFYSIYRLVKIEKLISFSFYFFVVSLQKHIK